MVRYVLWGIAGCAYGCGNAVLLSRLLLPALRGEKPFAAAMIGAAPLTHLFLLLAAAFFGRTIVLVAGCADAVGLIGCAVALFVRGKIKKDADETQKAEQT